MRAGARALRAPFLLLGMLIAAPAMAADVVSPRPDSVAVTIYRDGPLKTADLRNMDADDQRGLALIVETRVVDLPAGRSRLRFEGVASGVIPQSAAAVGLPGALIERNFDDDLLSPATLIAHSVGQSVRVIRTAARTGKETESRAVIRSGPAGVVLDFGDRTEALHCGGERERLVFDHAPAGLTDRPTLSVLTETPAAGRYTVTLSYLTLGLNWTADYVARVSPGGKTLALTGWITLANQGATGFADAPTAVVAGHLARAPLDLETPDRPTVETDCWPGQTTHGGWPREPAPADLQFRPPLPPPPPMMAAAPRTMVAEMVVTAQKRAIESQLGDYKLYTLAEPSTVAARQTKQVLFLDQPAVRFETVYAFEILDYAEVMETTPAAAGVVMRLDNREAEGLGRPLPGGSVEVRRPRATDGGGELLVGEAALARDVPVGEPFELTLDQARDVTVAKTVTGVTPDGKGHLIRDLAVRAANAKPYPVTVEIRHARLGAPGFAVASESAPHGLKSGDPLWRLAVPAGGETILRYSVRLDTR